VDRIKDRLPGKEGIPNGQIADNGLFVDTILDVLKPGIPWEDLPGHFGRPASVWDRFDRWCHAAFYGSGSRPP
jgi:transposase